MKSPELTIIGGGLAGLGLGIAMQKRGVPVTLHEAGHYPRHRVCGEFIRGIQPETLREMGIGMGQLDFEWKRSLSWFRGDDLIYEGVLSTPAMGISRYVLDRALAEQFQSLGGDLRVGSRVVQHGEGVVQSGGRRRQKDSRWVGLKIHARGVSLAADLEMHSGTERPGYVGLTEVEEGWVNVSGLFPKAAVLAEARGGAGRGAGRDPRARYAGALRQLGLGRLAEAIMNSEYREGSVSGIEGVAFGWQGVDSSRWVVGDQLSMIPPFTGNGMSIAFESAALAVEPLMQWSEGRKSWEAALATYHRRVKTDFKTRIQLAHAIHPIVTDTRFTRWTDAVLGSRLSPIPLLSEILR